ncbi:hypothetical protein BJ742DRAFT_798686, partial [Cladochytrium replicatum]
MLRASVRPTMPNEQKRVCPSDYLDQLFNYCQHFPSVLCNNNTAVSGMASTAPPSTAPAAAAAAVYSLEFPVKPDAAKNTNYITTTKYSILTFLPLFLFYQFQQFYNLYFLAGALSVLAGASSLSPISQVFPLLLVLVFTAAKELLEDYQRYRADRDANNVVYTVYRQGQKLEMLSRHIHPGDLIYIEKGQKMPVDAMIVSSSSQDGSCFIDTAELDGETNLKRRGAVHELSSHTSLNSVSTLHGRIECELPNPNLNTFEGRVILFSTSEALQDSLSTLQRHRHSLGGTIGPAQPRAPRTTTYPLTMNQLLLRGAVLRNTDFVWALVIYVGSNTKIIKNLKRATGKASTLQRKLNTFVLWAFVINAALLASSVALEIVRYMGLERQERAREAAGETVDYAVEWYLGPQDRSFSAHILTTVFSYFGIYTYVIPISLFVSMEVVRLAQGRFMFWDKLMEAIRPENDWDPAAKPVKYKMKPNNTGLNEDLGAVEYVFSDKTGTLTRNEMKMAQWWVGGRVFGEMEKPGSLLEIIQDDVTPTWIKVQATELLLALGLCHSVIPSLDERTGKYVYESQSPDESALLHGVAANKFRLTTRSGNTVTVLSPRDEPLVYEQLAALEFTSARKRMSVVVRRVSGGKGGSLYPPQTGLGDRTDRILLYCKGADNIILERLSKDPAVNPPAYIEATNEALERFSTEGLRTLCIAMREMTLDEYATFREALDEAERSLEDREGKIDAVCATVEKELQLVGATAIEDKLQDAVPETIEYLLRANVRVWLLTGDKQETAINIGMSSKLIMGDMKVLILNTGSVGETVEKVEQMLEEVDRGPDDQRYTLVINGSSLGHVFSTSPLLKDTSGPRSLFSRLTGKGKTTPTTTEPVVNAKSKSGVPLDQLFLRLGTQCHSVICCRVTPLQKSLVVKLVRKHLNKVTLAIGDGANDVSMIQEADIGVGIMGREGTQAVRASDYAFMEFRFLRRLLSVHGRYSYARMSRLILYSFYKNLAFITVQWWFGFVSGWSGQTAYEEIFFSAFNVVYTSIPPLVMAIFEQDVPEPAIAEHPELYHQLTSRHPRSNAASAYIPGAKRPRDSSGIYWNWVVHFGMVASAFWHSLAIFGSVYFIASEGTLDPDGYSVGYWVQCYYFGTPVLITVLVKSLLMSERWTWGMGGVVFASFLVHVAMMFLLEVMKYVEAGTSIIAHVLPTYYFVCIVIPVICLLPDFLLLYLKRQFFPNDAHIISEQVAAATKKAKAAGGKRQQAAIRV